jgi:hypothetical protein
MTRIVARILQPFNLGALNFLPGVPGQDYGKVVEQKLNLRREK